MGNGSGERAAPQKIFGLCVQNDIFWCIFGTILSNVWAPSGHLLQCPLMATPASDVEHTLLHRMYHRAYSQNRGRPIYWQVHGSGTAHSSVTAWWLRSKSVSWTRLPVRLSEHVRVLGVTISSSDLGLDKHVSNVWQISCTTSFIGLAFQSGWSTSWVYWCTDASSTKQLARYLMDHDISKFHSPAY